MTILLTGNKGFVGSHVESAFEADSHEVVGLEAAKTFQQWYNEMSVLMDTPIDAIVHIGAVSENQSEDPDIYEWNARASFHLAKRASSIPFIFFSSYLVNSTMHDWESRSPYTKTKAFAEELVSEVCPHATIIRPGVMWGKETNKNPRYRTVPYMLTTRTLKKMYRGWGRNYVHIADVIKAVKICVENRPAGTFSLVGDRVWVNEDLAELVKWKGYEWVDNDLKYQNSHPDVVDCPRIPGWQPKVRMEDEVPRLERLWKVSHAVA